MKRILAVLLLLTVMTGCVYAGAETTVKKTELDLKRVYLNRDNDLLYGYTKNGEYYIYDTEGNALNKLPYDDLTPREFGFEMKRGEGLHTKGYVDTFGREIVPPVYADTDELSERWIAGITLEESTSDNYDYKIINFSGDNQFMLIAGVDIYYHGKMVGSLNRSQYRSAEGYGDYLIVRDRDGKPHHYNSEFVEGDPEKASSSEYDSTYSGGKTTYWHCGSGQQAFTEGCTLTPDSVRKSIIEEKGKLIDLQGNVIATVNYYSVYSFDGGYARVKNREGKFGMIDETGKEILPCVYDDIDYRGFVSGYVSAVKDGKQGFVSLDGTETGFVYAENAVKVYTPFAFVQQLDGTVSVISAMTGEMAERFAEYDTYNCCPCAVLKNADGAVGAIALDGTVLVPFDGTYEKTSELSVSRDGTVILAKKTVYTVSYDTASPADEDPAAEETADDAPAAWVCPNCGRTNDPDAKFCPEDATPRPVPVTAI